MITPIVQHIAAHAASIESWFTSQWAQIKPPVYTSVDIRDSGFKLSPVDTNLFPAGFNNLTPTDRKAAATTARHIIRQWAPDCRKLLIIAEQHTRNPYYLEHLACLQSILEAAGFEIKLSTLMPTAHDLTTPSDKPIHLATLTREANTLKAGDFLPDGILLNNDLSEGLPAILTDLNQPILPSTQLGWHQRYKSSYFGHYNQVCQALADHLQWDSWLLNPLFSYCDDIDFMTSKGKENLIDEANMLFERIAEKYKVYNITEKPYIVVKADAGSYGMGVLTIESPDELRQLSRKKRSHMSKTKGNQAIQRVLLQEGVSSHVYWNSQIAEPVVYLMGATVVGGFYRTHSARDAKANLNTPGMELIPIEFGQYQIEYSSNNMTDEQKQRYAYSVIARLSALAAAFENIHLS